MRVFLITEDAARGAHDVVRRLCRATLSLVDEDADLQQIEWVQLPSVLRPAASPSAWATRGDQQENLRDLVARVAEELLRGQHVFVVWHFDGDQPWSTGRRDNEERFEAVIRRRVRHHLSSTSMLALERLLTLVPYYSIEAWLFQNSAKLRDELPEADQLTVARWQESPHILDDLLKVKDCLGVRDRRNAELARGWPARQVYGVGRSFAAVVERWRASEHLARSLRGITWS